jgi:spermidine/putrescine transport system ATP-binding protein
MQGVLTRLQRELGITFIYVTHSQSEAFAMADRVVIMNEGEIAQIGSPKAIYREPASTFVAEFVGCNNIIGGTVSDIDATRTSVTSSLGDFTVVAPSSSPPALNDQVAFVVSADRVSVSNQRPDGDNAVACQLRSEVFVGSVVTLYLEAPDGSELKAQIQQRELDDINPEPGADLWVGWAAEHGHVLGAESHA